MKPFEKFCKKFPDEQRKQNTWDKKSWVVFPGGTAYMLLGPVTQDITARDRLRRAVSFLTGAGDAQIRLGWVKSVCEDQVIEAVFEDVNDPTRDCRYACVTLSSHQVIWLSVSSFP